MRRKLCLAGVERLESRRLLSVSPATSGEGGGNGIPVAPPGEFIAPPLGLPPIELQPGLPDGGDYVVSNTVSVPRPE